VRLSNGQTRWFGVAEGVPAGLPQDLAIDPNGNVVAAIGDQLVTGREGGWRVQTLAGADGNPRIRSVLVDRDGGAWAGGARLWDRAPGHAGFIASVVAAHGVTALAQAPDGRVWVAESTTGTIFPVTAGGSHSASDRKYFHLSSA